MPFDEITIHDRCLFWFDYPRLILNELILQQIWERPIYVFALEKQNPASESSHCKCKRCDEFRQVIRTGMHAVDEMRFVRLH